MHCPTTVLYRKVTLVQRNDFGQIEAPIGEVMRDELSGRKRHRYRALPSAEFPGE